MTGSEPIVLDTFSPDQAFECFAARLGKEKANAERERVERLSEMLGYLPIAVDVAAATIAAEDTSVTAWLSAYPDEERALETLALDPEDEAGMGPGELKRRRIVRTVLRLSLCGLTPLARRLLYALACFDHGSGGHRADSV